MYYSTKVVIIFILVGSFILPATSQNQEPKNALQPQSQQTEMQLDRATMALRNGGSLLEAKARLDKVLTLEPQNIFALKMRSQILIRLGLNNDAHQDATQITLLDANDGVAWILYAETAILLNNLPVAYEALLKAEILVPERKLAILLQLSIVSQALGKLTESVNYAEQVFRLAPDQEKAVLNYIDVLVVTRRPAEAATILANSINAGTLSVENIDVQKYLNILKGESALQNRSGK